MTWTKAADAIGTRDPTPAEEEAIEEVREIAVAFAKGYGTLADVRRATSGKQRWLATRFTPPNHPAFRPLMGLLDALIAAQGGVPTKHGIIDPALLRDTGGTINRGTGEVRFPIAYEGGRGVFRSKDQRGPAIAPFTTTPTRADEKEFWET
jgi:hypothetical protein